MAGELPAQCRRLETPRAGRRSGPIRVEARSRAKPPSAQRDGGRNGCSCSGHRVLPVPRAPAHPPIVPAAQDLGHGLHDPLGRWEARAA